PLPRSSRFPYTTLFRSPNNSPVSVRVIIPRLRDRWFKSSPRNQIFVRRSPTATAVSRTHFLCAKNALAPMGRAGKIYAPATARRSEEHTSELQSPDHLV